MLRTAALHAAKPLAAASLLLAMVVGGSAAHARGLWWGEPSSTAVATTIAVAELPRSGQKTYRLILAGGPFPFDKDGAVFGNRERLLPVMKRGYYREYTVRTPGVRHRGARRIVCGGLQPTAPEACYYTSDHYASFRKIQP
ncbi:ribonuclease N [Comamonadaceae bacterium OH2545_COT-014]|nr:ribonuclease N [Comamonadaceae bacterium OH2545_COT-014]